ncbi:MBL fold metallo-hydrolase [Clostridium luticellarii]|jgi:L-ascorbate metabolism protein UlaG (beta-lactamase superfamily)|uniref:Metal-dependent hydrolase n=1 Tax=Clostridium luticellarii TaxID=1691940 RepID=A0A2T0BE19_9CLOT|nr:MBL fold metallo-hydrolase [Clostridium luticellarii]MCI1944925.1 MBL fold metallo-hydrolase [Clostridium luticellarii]MCI1968399.1 MBL fold metallo-hydrolase [Clostridium luticellarii]MCI1995397.1 MBL fold metallo-hydrolase [Clostridium luticellarii]MCI2039460.1 MBL fold metallo-hydrolase [Clostridium luticellarii]PRR82114.1 metal-dependent hydrolase [Clostridium luticellarii]
MKIQWLGHSSFLLEDSKSHRLLTDPFDETVGYQIFQGEVDLITISHNHFDHNYTQDIKCSHIINETGSFNLCGINIIGIPSYHDKVKGAKRGKNIIFIIEMDGYRICHLGDLGYTLSSKEVEELGSIDVLLIPVGGNFTIDGKEAASLAKSINSHIIIPMHYKTSSLTFELDGLEKFLKYMKNAERLKSNTLTLENNLQEYNSVKILDFK